MKYLCIWEFDPEDTGKIIEKWRQAMAEIKEKGVVKGIDAKKIPKSTKEGFLPCGKSVCYSFYEADNAEQLNMPMKYYLPEVKKAEYIPIISWSEFVEVWEKMKI